MAEFKRVLLCVMPFLPIERPPLGVGLLKSALCQRGIECDLTYYSHRFADEIGFKLYQQIAHFTPSHDLVGEWIFSRALFGETARDDRQFATMARAAPGEYYDEALIGQITYCRTVADRFIHEVAAEIDTNRYGFIGFSTTFQQNIPSLALARRLKEIDPSLVVVFGGANCEDEMGVELHRCFPFIDVVCSGEADESFSEVVEAIHFNRSLDHIPNVIFRLNGYTQSSVQQQHVVERLDTLPFPDHSDFLEAFRRSTVSLFMEPELTVETSRGCWWGEKQQCIFCGLNGRNLYYRSKSPERAVEEIRHLRDTYGLARFFCTDNILDMHYFDAVFPELAKDGTAIELHYEMKSNLKKEHLRALREMGTTWLQPGIESLSTRILRLMRKGVRGIQNIQTLKWAAEYGFRVTWNMLCGFPGERPEDYEEVMRTIRLIPHLTPPSSFAVFRLDRFSPMFNQPDQFGLADVRPYPAYALCYPLEPVSLARIAYFFKYSGASDAATRSLLNRAWELKQWWKLNHAKSRLIARVTPNLLLIEDTRAGREPNQTLLLGKERLVYLAADSVRTAASATRWLRQEYPQYTWAQAQVEDLLEFFVSEGLAFKEENLYLSLGVLCHE